jgi:hypothetical protein
MGYHVFALGDTRMLPYGTSGERFMPMSSEEVTEVTDMRTWSAQLPLQPKNINTGTQGAETDIILRLYSYMKMGIEKNDPYIILAYNGAKAYSMILDNQRANHLLKYA